MAPRRSNLSLVPVDEKNFVVVVDEIFNRRNSRVIARDSSCVPPGMQSKHSASVMVFGDVASNGKECPFTWLNWAEDQHGGIFEDSAVSYLTLDEKLWSYESHDYPELWACSRVKTVHTLLMTYRFLCLQMSGPRTHDSNPCDYWLGDTVEKVSNARPHNSVGSYGEHFFVCIQGVTEIHVQNWTMPIKSKNKTFYKNDKKRLTA